MLFTWQTELEVGVPVIDQQHCNLVLLINRYYDSMIDRTNLVRVEPVLDELIAYTRSHFQEEERLMAESAYPGYEVHRRQHEDLKERVMALKEEVHQPRKALSVRLAIFLREWLMDHIVASDREFGRFLKEAARDTGTVAASGEAEVF